VIHALNECVREIRARELPPADFTFIDLFAGIGGTRLGFDRSWRCVFTSEYDDLRQNLQANFRPDLRSHRVTSRL